MHAQTFEEMFASVFSQSAKETNIRCTVSVKAYAFTQLNCRENSLSNYESRASTQRIAPIGACPQKKRIQLHYNELERGK